MSDPIVLNMSIPTRNQFLQKVNIYLCDWGQRKTPYTKEGTIKGSPAPLWLNPAPTFFKVFSALMLFCALLFVAAFVFFRFYNKSNVLSGLTVRNYTLLPANVTYEEFLANTTAPTNSTTMEPIDVYCIYISYQEIVGIFILIGAIIVFSNAFHMMYMGCSMDYASDQEWSRNLVFSSILWILCCGFSVGDIIYAISLVSYKSERTGEGLLFNDTTTSCNNLFDFNTYANFAVAGLTGILCVFQIIRLLGIAKKFFLSDYVEHDARSDDENIVIMK